MIYEWEYKIKPGLKSLVPLDKGSIFTLKKHRFKCNENCTSTKNGGSLSWYRVSGLSVRGKLMEFVVDFFNIKLNL